MIGELKIQIPQEEKESIVEMLMEKLTPLLLNQNKVVKNEDGDTILSRTEAMNILKIKETKMNQIIQSGEIPIIRINRRVLIKKQDILKFIDKNIIN